MTRKISFIVIILLQFSSPVFADNSIVSKSDGIGDITLTVYNYDIAFISELRNIELPSGRVELTFYDIPSSIIPASARLEALDGTGKLSLIENRYEYDLSDELKLSSKYVGKEVKLLFIDPVTGRESTKDATLLKPGRKPVLRIGKDIVFDMPGKILYPPLSDDVFGAPAIIWVLDNGSEGPRLLRTTYLARSISWEANHTLMLSQDESSADLSSTVTMYNSSGMNFLNAKLILIAGEINLETGSAESEISYSKPMSREADVIEEKVFEYYSYELERRYDLMNEERKNLMFRRFSDVPLVKKFFIEGDEALYFSQYRQGVARGSAGVMLELKNGVDSGIGKPLPAGIIRVYKEDSGGRVQFVGEDRIEHSPPGELIRIRTGSAFDIVTERKQTDWLRIAEGVFESSIEVKIRNYKNEDVVITVIEPVPGDWMVLKTSHDFRKTSSDVLEFDIGVPAGKEAVLDYRIRVIL
ncbi:MAG: hypothetical protein JSV21_00930 [Nitrospirota bacterium]|nr:MAG: hypothetical protein JSV21_00930 [Nitrospirota bacterium]